MTTPLSMASHHQIHTIFLPAQCKPPRTRFLLHGVVFPYLREHWKCFWHSTIPRPDWLKLRSTRVTSDIDLEDSHSITGGARRSRYCNPQGVDSSRGVVLSQWFPDAHSACVTVYREVFRSLASTEQTPSCVTDKQRKGEDYSGLVIIDTAIMLPKLDSTRRRQGGETVSSTVYDIDSDYQWEKIQW